MFSSLLTNDAGLLTYPRQINWDNIKNLKKDKFIRKHCHGDL